MCKYILIGCVSLLTITIVFLTTTNKKINQMPNSVNVYVNGIPTSSDPLDIDLMYNYFVFRSILSGLVTNHQKGCFTGELAESWKSSDDSTIWSFSIRKNVDFDNGDPITHEIIRLSLMRMAYLLKNRHSESGLLEFLVGYDHITSPTTQIDGLVIENDHLVFKFTKPMPKLLTLLSFGLYTITHPSDYSPKTGEWLNTKKVVSSGMYRLKAWSDHAIDLELRDGFLSEYQHTRPLKQIHIEWNDDFRGRSDIILGTSMDNKIPANYIYNDNLYSGIIYMQCYSWTHPKSIFHDIKNRKLIRTELYRAIETSGFKITRSFFPTTISNVHELSNDPIASDSDLSDLYKHKPFLARLPFGYRNTVAYSALESGIRQLNSKKQINIEIRNIPAVEAVKNDLPYLSHYTLDLGTYGTEILSAAPDDDIRFMFLSKEGIQLPDTDGRIHELLKEEPLNIQKINETLWDQAVIWPITHMSRGLWTNPKIDVSHLNPLPSPTQFQWIGWKE